MTHSTAIVVVDLNGQNGTCSNCGTPAAIDTAHSCGARVVGVAIDLSYAMDPTLGQAKRISDLCPPGVEFVGVGRVVEAATGYCYEQSKRPGDLS